LKKEISIPLSNPRPLNTIVRQFWEAEPCGTSEDIVGNLPKESLEWFERIEKYRYSMEPFIFSVAQFDQHKGKRMLEVGVGAGTDHLQWARAGAECHGVDLTDAGIETTRCHLKYYGFTSDLQRVDAEHLPFPDNHFDLIYSWGVIHHSERPEQILGEIHRVLKPGGQFIGMMYSRYSLRSVRFWVKHALLKGKPWLSLGDVIWDHMESLGTKAYTIPEMRRFLRVYADVSFQKFVTPYELTKLPTFLKRLVPSPWGWYITWKARK
jgi:ubiquinone/menaquinone biosynthesis C-methylase UbiE